MNKWQVITLSSTFNQIERRPLPWTPPKKKKNGLHIRQISVDLDWSSCIIIFIFERAR